MRNQIKPCHRINEMKMKKQLFDGVFIIVEGATDSRFFKKFFDKNKCNIIAALSKDNVLEIMSKLSWEKLFAIIDADYLHLENNQISEDNIFLTDTHDIETMIIKSPALDNFLCEYADHDKLENYLDRSDYRDLKSILIMNSILIGYVKWVSIKNNLNLSFKELEYKSFLDLDNSLEFLVDDFFDHLISNSPNYNGTKDLIINKIKEIKSSEYDNWQLCSGHDMTEILLIFLHNDIGIYTANSLKNRGMLEGALRMSYEGSFYKDTNLYFNIKNWAEERNLSIFDNNKF